jgi:hypothetical protein
MTKEEFSSLKVGDVIVYVGEFGDYNEEEVILELEGDNKRAGSSYLTFESAVDRFPGAHEWDTKQNILEYYILPENHIPFCKYNLLGESIDD